MRMQFIAAALAAITLSTAAQADSIQAYGDAVSVDIRYGDLDVKRSAGAEILLSRVKHAATVVCGGVPSIRSLRERREFKACFNETTKNIVNDLNMPLVNAVYLQKVEEDRFAAAD